MSIDVICGTCSRQHELGDEEAGRTRPCDGCGSAMAVPELEAISDEEDIAEEFGEEEGAISMTNAPLTNAPPPNSAIALEYQSSNNRISGTAWNSGGILFVKNEAVLPGTCVKCGQPSARTIRKTFYWTPRWVIIVFIVSRLIGLILFFVLRRNVKFTFSLCERHLKRIRNIRIGLGIAMLVVAAITVGVAMWQNEPGWFVLGIVIEIILLIAMLVAGASLKPIRIENNVGQFKGCSAEFLRQL